uniref:DNA cytosine methyltransferase n=1 Tax=Tetragenococcus koreensis TaxID=290335 RepID=UPI001926B5F6
MKQLTLGSLFDGIGAFPLAASRNNILPLWASEIEKAPILITQKHFPNMKHLGDVTKIHGGKIPKVDIITFGSPCQNLSVIGNRKGLIGEQSNLFYEAIRIIDEMKEATNGKYPTLAIWENVLGAFSSNDRMDFKAVLESFTKREIPIPPFRRWTYAGMVRGRGVDVCWRVLDSQYWGVPQRRKRVFLVADFRDFRAREVLFDSSGMPSSITACATSWTTAAPRNRISTAKTGRQIWPFQGRRMRSAAKAKDIKGFRASFGAPATTFPTLLTDGSSGFADWFEGKEKEGVVRRLTPLECERLMGLPDEWTKKGSDHRRVSDSARYKALGNSIVIPCADFLFSNIRKIYGN